MLEVNKNSIVFRLAHHLCSSTPLVIIAIVIVNFTIIIVFCCYDIVISMNISTGKRYIRINGTSSAISIALRVLLK